MNKFTSNELSKKLWENECRLKTESFLTNTHMSEKLTLHNSIIYLDILDSYFRINSIQKLSIELYLKNPNEINKVNDGINLDKKEKQLEKCKFYPTFDILWDICVKYAKEFFGSNYQLNTVHIFTMLQLDLEKKYTQDEIENYIWDNCTFKNKKNKEDENKI